MSVGYAKARRARRAKYFAACLAARQAARNAEQHGCALLECRKARRAYRECDGNRQVINYFCRTYISLGIILEKCGDQANAEAAYRTVITVDPGHARAHSKLGVILEKKGYVNGAKAEYRTAIALDPRYKKVHRNLSSDGTS